MQQAGLHTRDDIVGAYPEIGQLKVGPDAGYDIFFVLVLIHFTLALDLLPVYPKRQLQGQLNIHISQVELETGPAGGAKGL